MLGETGGRGAVLDRYYAQLRYPAGRRWVSVAVSDTGDAAATIAAKADRLFRCQDRRAPRLHVRVASATDVCREGGEEAVIRADADLRDFADQAW